MRIISGKYGKRVLLNKIPIGIRPTTDQVREAIFNVLENMIDFNGKFALDLFSGTGAVGIELLSRGCTKVNFVDNSINSIELIKSNLSKLEIAKEQFSITKIDAIKFIKKTTDKFDIIFADPPYKNNFFFDIMESIYKADILTDNGVFIYETEGKMNLISSSNYVLQKEQKFGNAKVYYFFIKKHNN